MYGWMDGCMYVCLSVCMSVRPNSTWCLSKSPTFDNLAVAGCGILLFTSFWFTKNCQALQRSRRGPEGLFLLETWSNHGGFLERSWKAARSEEIYALQVLAFRLDRPIGVAVCWVLQPWNSLFFFFFFRMCRVRGPRWPKNMLWP